jgi:hypothetical protein
MPDNARSISGGFETYTDLSGSVRPGGTAGSSFRIATLLQYHERGSDRLTCGYELKLDRVD